MFFCKVKREIGDIFYNVKIFDVNPIWLLIIFAFVLLFGWFQVLQKAKVVDIIVTPLCQCRTTFCCTAISYGSSCFANMNCGFCGICHHRTLLCVCAPACRSVDNECQPVFNFNSAYGGMYGGGYNNYGGYGSLAYGGGYRQDDCGELAANPGQKCGFGCSCRGDSSCIAGICSCAPNMILRNNFCVRIYQPRPVALEGNDLKPFALESNTVDASHLPTVAAEEHQVLVEQVVDHQLQQVADVQPQSFKAEKNQPLIFEVATNQQQQNAANELLPFASISIQLQPFAVIENQGQSTAIAPTSPNKVPFKVGSKCIYSKDCVLGASCIKGICKCRIEWQQVDNKCKRKKPEIVVKNRNQGVYQFTEQNDLKFVL